MRYEIPIEEFEEMIGLGLWVGHRFDCDGQTLILKSIGQAQRNGDGDRVIPVEIVAEERMLSANLDPA